MPCSQLQRSVGKTAAPALPKVNWDAQLNYGNAAGGHQKPYKRQYRPGGRGSYGIKSEPQYSSGNQPDQPPVDAAANVMRAGRGQQQSESRHRPPRQPYCQRNGSHKRRNPLEEHSACFFSEVRKNIGRYPMFLKEMIDEFAKRSEVANEKRSSQAGG